MHINKIAHRNLSCENILVGDNEVLKITNYGVSRILKDIHGRAYNNLKTFACMSPEVLKGEKYDNSADIWSLGCILYQMCTYNVIQYLKFSFLIPKGK